MILSKRLLHEIEYLLVVRRVFLDDIWYFRSWYTPALPLFIVNKGAVGAPLATLNTVKELAREGFRGCVVLIL